MVVDMQPHETGKLLHGGIRSHSALPELSPMAALISHLVSQHVPVHCGQALRPMCKLLSEHVAEHPFVSTRLAVGAPEHSTQKDHKPDRQKQVGQDQVPPTADDGA